MQTHEIIGGNMKRLLQGALVAALGLFLASYAVA